MNNLFSVSCAKLIKFPYHDSLTIYESPTPVPFDIKRIFTINEINPCKRGLHAHKKCAQLLVCLQGKVKVTVDDGKVRKEFALAKSTEGLFVPSTLWAEQEYEKNTILMVLTDRPYEIEDYIRDYSEFLSFRKTP